MTYQVPSAAIGALRLHYNENTAGCSPAVLEALRSLTREDAATYPDYGPITARVEKWFGVRPGSVQLTNGLDEGLQVVTQCAVWHAAQAPRGQAGRPQTVIVEPAFEMYAACTEAVRAESVHLTPEPNFRFPLEAMLAALSPATRLVYLTDPNNPTGLPIPDGAVETIARAAPDAIVFVDEAYGDFSGRTAIGSLLERQPNVIVGRTFAKAYGLAALRVGALVATPRTLDRVRPLLAPFSVNVCAIRALEAALADAAYLPWYVGEARASRDLIYGFCGRLGFEYWPSEANFVLFRIGDRAGAAARAMQARGIIVRDKSAAPGCAGCIRMTAGLVAHTRAALATLEDILASGTR